MIHYISTLKENFSFKNIIMTFVIVFLPIFSFGIFAPTEIFFANYTAFGVIFGEFGWTLLAYGALIGAAITLLSLFLPHIIQKVLFTILWIISLGGYIQTMFLNTGLPQIGATAEGYVPTTAALIKDGIVWVAVIIAAIFVILKYKENWKKPVFFVSLMLTLIQGIAYGTLFLSAPEAAFAYPDSEISLSGEKQYTVSANENVIVFILDTFSNVFFEDALAEYPEISDIVSDFTYYNNTDSNYYGTFPSVPHILTGYDFDPSIPVNDWLNQCWNNDATAKFYKELHNAGFLFNVYVTEPTLLSGSKSLELVKGKIDNLTSENYNLSVDYPLLYKTLLTMSCYRFMPDCLKPYFHVPNTQYISIASQTDNIIHYANPDFYSGLLENGLTTDADNNYFIIQHLNGTHEFINDENCARVPEGTVSYEATVRGIFTMLEEYINQLKSNGVYDNSTIIITADHGTIYNSQCVFLIKEPNTIQDAMQTTNAPITLDELLPTVAELTLDKSDYLGKSIYDFSENEQRERTFYVRAFDENFPIIKTFDGKDATDMNVYQLYTYTGNYQNYLEQYNNYIYTVVPAKEAYY